MQARLRSIGLAAALLVAVAAPAAARGPALTAAAYRQKAAALCTALTATRLPQGGPLAVATFRVTEAARFLASLRRLQPPRALAKLHAKLVATIGEEVASYRAGISAYRAGTITAAQITSSPLGLRLSVQEGSLWRELHVTGC